MSYIDNSRDTLEKPKLGKFLLWNGYLSLVIINGALIVIIYLVINIRNAIYNVNEKIIVMISLPQTNELDIL